MARLEEPFGSPPGRPGKYVLYLQRDSDPDGHSMACYIFAAKYAAKKFIEALAGEGYEWVGDTIIRTETRTTVRCDKLKAILDHEYTLAEMGWDLPDPHRGYARRYHLVGDLAIEEAKNPEMRAERAAKTRTPRASRDGMTSIGDLAEELGIPPRDARGVLRKAKMPKPAQGWAWPASEVEAIREMLRKASAS